MRSLRFGSPALLLVLFVAPALAQSNGAPETSSPDSAPAKPATTALRRHQPPCWRQAGIAANQVNQRWKLEDQGKARIAAVCTETSTSAQQKQTKIQMINTETQQEIASIIPAKQLQAFNACQSDYEKNHPKPASEKELGPCGGVIRGSAAEESVGDHMDH
jgi:hypothetical protein